MLKELTMEKFTDTLASDSPVPGGGSASAMAGAIGASLVAMVASLTIDKTGYEAQWDEMKKIKQEMMEYRAFFLDAMDRDADSYAKVIDCFKLPKGSEEEKSLRLNSIQDALYGAALVPLEIAEKAVGIFDFAKLVVEKGNKNAISDGAVAALMARASVKGALHNVMINATSLKSVELKNVLSEKTEELKRVADKKEKEVMERIEL